MQTETTRSSPLETGNHPFEVCREAADYYFNSGRPLYITAKDICSSIARTTSMARLEIESYDPAYRDEGPFIIDLRDSDSEMHELYYYGHIPGSLNVPWRQLTRFKTVSALPDNRQIVVYSNNGQTGGQLAAILSVMGYDAVNLKWGMSAWTRDELIAPDRFRADRDILWQNSTYRSTVAIDLEPEIFYPLPSPSTDAQTESAIIWSAADEYIREYKPANISASSLYDPLFQILPPIFMSPYEDDPDQLLVLPFGVKPDENDEPFSWPFILDVREISDFNIGHIPGALNIPVKEVFKTENLRRLPDTERIIVCSNTGHTSAHVVPLLNMLGYDAINLKWGMSGWSHSSELNCAVPYRNDKDSSDYPVVKGWLPGRPVACKS